MSVRHAVFAVAEIDPCTMNPSSMQVARNRSHHSPHEVVSPAARSMRCPLVLVRSPAMSELRLAELIAALSQTTDLGMGQPPESAIRTCLLATAIAREMHLSDHEIGDVYYTTLLQH